MKIKPTVLAYYSPLGFYLSLKNYKKTKNETLRYHLKQSLGLQLLTIFLYFIVYAIIGGTADVLKLRFFPVLIFLIISFSVLTFYIFKIWRNALFNANLEIKKPVKILGDKFELWFSFI